MLAVKSMDVRDNFKSLCDKVFNGETLIISRPKNENVVMLSEYEYNEMMKEAAKDKRFINRTIKCDEDFSFADGEVQGEREAEGPQRDGAPPLRTPLPRLFVCVHATFPSSRAPSCARGSRRRPSRRPSPRRIRGVRRHARARARRDRPPPWRPGRP